MKKDNVVLRFFFDWLLVILGVLGSIYCLITAFDLAVPESFSWVSISSLAVFSLVLGDKKRDKIFAFYSALCEELAREGL